MVSLREEPSVRVNGSTLSQYVGQPVVLMGVVDKIDQSGMMITVRASDGDQIQVKLKEPLQDNIEGLIEVHGTGQGKQVVCDNYVTFTSEDASEFDMDSYDQAIKLIHAVNSNPWKPE